MPCGASTRVLQLMARDGGAAGAVQPGGARQGGAAHIHITRHLSLAATGSPIWPRAGMTKQAMGDLVTQCEAWGLVTRERPA
jgi:hypothetical protein